MSVATFDHVLYQPRAVAKPLALAGLRRVRWSVLLALSANIALWGGIAHGVSALLHP